MAGLLQQVIRTLRRKGDYRKALLTLSLGMLTGIGVVGMTQKGMTEDEVQDDLRELLVDQEVERAAFLEHYQIKRQALIDEIQRVASVQPVDQAKIRNLQQDLDRLQQTQNSEQQLLHDAHQTGQEESRLAIRRADGHGEAIEPYVEFATALEALPGFDRVDKRGQAVGGEAAIAVFTDRLDIEVGVGGFEDNSEITGIEVRNSATKENFLTLDPSELAGEAVLGPVIEPLVPEVVVGPPNPMPALGMGSLNLELTPELSAALLGGNAEIVISVNGEEALAGQFIDGLKFEALEYLLDPSLLPEPLVKDGNFNTLGTLSDLVVKDQEKMLVLGKSLFWDVQVGSDNRTSCASCHNFAGADWRTRNQFATADGIGTNRDVTLGDFPLGDE